MVNMLLDRRRRSVSALTGSVGGYRPEVDLSFARDRYSIDQQSVDLSSAVTFARSGTATYIDANGTLQTAADGVARVGSHVWDGSAWVASGLRFESKAFTNLNTYTTASAANWPAGSSTVADISENALGVFPGITVASGGSVDDRASIPAFAASSGTTYAGAVLFKYGTSNGFTLRLRDVTGGVESQINSVAQVVSVGTVLAGAVNDVLVADAGPDGLKLLTFTLDANFTGDLLVGFGPNTATAGLNVKAFALQIGVGTEAGSWVLTKESLTKGIVADTTNTDASGTTSLTQLNGDYFGFPGLQVASDGQTWHRALDPSGSNPELTAGQTYSIAVLYQYGTSGKGTAALLAVDAGVSSSLLHGVSGSVWSPFFEPSGTFSNVSDEAVSGLVRLLTFDFVPTYSGRYQLGFGPNSAVVGENIILAAWHMVHEDDAGFPCGIMQGESLSVPSANTPDLSGGFTVAMDGYLNYTDNNAAKEADFWKILRDGANYALVRMRTDLGTGRVYYQQNSGGTFDSVSSGVSDLSPGLNVPFSIASRHTASDVNGALNGSAFTANTTVTGLVDLSSTDMVIGEIFNGHIKSIRIFGRGLNDDLLELATT